MQGAYWHLPGSWLNHMQDVAGMFAEPRAVVSLRVEAPRPAESALSAKMPEIFNQVLQMWQLPETIVNAGRGRGVC